MLPNDWTEMMQWFGAEMRWAFMSSTEKQEFCIRQLDIPARKSRTRFKSARFLYYELDHLIRFHKSGRSYGSPWDGPVVQNFITSKAFDNPGSNVLKFGMREKPLAG